MYSCGLCCDVARYGTLLDAAVAVQKSLVVTGVWVCTCCLCSCTFTHALVAAVYFEARCLTLLWLSSSRNIFICASEYIYMKSEYIYMCLYMYV